MKFVFCTKQKQPFSEFLRENVAEKLSVSMPMRQLKFIIKFLSFQNGGDQFFRPKLFSNSKLQHLFWLGCTTEASLAQCNLQGVNNLATGFDLLVIYDGFLRRGRIFSQVQSTVGVVVELAEKRAYNVSFRMHQKFFIRKD